MSKNDNLPVIERMVRISRIYPEDLQSHFVNHFVIQHRPDYFIVSFFELWPPAILADTDEERQRVIEELDEIEAKCVARMVITPAKMGEFLDALQDNFEKFQKMKEELSK